MACGISAPQLELTPAPPALEASGLNPWATGEVPKVHFQNRDSRAPGGQVLHTSYT